MESLEPAEAKKRLGRPKGPDKVKVVLSLTVPTFNWLLSKTDEGQSVANYLAEHVEGNASASLKKQASTSLTNQGDKSRPKKGKQ